MIGFVTDVHFGNHRLFGGGDKRINNRFRMIGDVFENALKSARSASADSLCIAGDLFDTDKPSPAQLSKVLELTQWVSELDIYALVGNHDRTSYALNDYAFSPYGPLPLFTCVADLAHFWARGNVLVTCVPTLPKHDQALMRTIEDALAAPESELGVMDTYSRRYFVVHAGVMDDSTPHYLKNASGALEVNEFFAFMDRHRIEVSVCGDWHAHKIWSRDSAVLGKKQHIVQLGALVPTGFDNPGLDDYGRLLLLPAHADQPIDFKTCIKEIPGPRFLTVRYEDPEFDSLVVRAEIERMNTSGHKIFLRVRCLPENVKLVRKEVTALVDKGCINDYDIQLSKEFLKHQVQAAATRIRTAASFEEALAAYVQTVPLPEGVTRKGVLEKIRHVIPQKQT